jgi:hypothetical protein
MREWDRERGTMIALFHLDTLGYKETDTKNARLIKRNPLTE